MKTSKSKNIRSRGFGDTVHKVAHAVGAHHVARAYEKATGKPCGCSERRDSLNRKFPYSK